MAEQLVNEFTVNRPIDEAWPLITDVERIAPCLPGAQLQEIEGETYRGIVKIKLGAINSQFKGEANFIERNDEEYRAVIKAAGRDTGGRGNASAEITAQAESLSPTSTHVSVTTDLHITGKVAQFGRGIMGDVSAKIMAQFADNLNEMLDQEALGGSSDDNESDGGESDSGADTESDTKSAHTEADGPVESDTVSDDDDATPQVRKIDGPAKDPIDLMEVGGSSVVKRAAPALLALLILLLVLRRRRS